MPAQDFAPGRSDVRQFHGGPSFVRRIAGFRESIATVSLPGQHLAVRASAQPAPGNSTERLSREGSSRYAFGAGEFGSGGHVKRLFVLQDRDEEDTGEGGV